MNRLCGRIGNEDLAYLSRWHPILLNQRAGLREMIDPTAGLGLASEEIDKVISSILNHKKLNWSADQKQCIASCRSFPERVLIIQGFPGTGKTFVIVGMMVIYAKLGLHISLGSDALCRGRNY